MEERGFDLITCLEETGDIVAIKAHEKNIELLVDVVDLDPEISCRVIGDTFRLRQILINLAMNGKQP